jgi:hypothetical protein
MPKPNKGEKQKEFIARCIPIVMNEGTTDDNKQAAAICFSLWRRRNQKKSKSRSEEILEESAKAFKELYAT